MKRVRWLSDERVLPGIGHVTRGSVSPEMPNEVADQYIRQGEAGEVVDAPKRSSKPATEGDQ